MTNPASGGEYDAAPEQVPHLERAGWERASGQDGVEVEEWPDELKRFGGQESVELYLPTTGAYYTAAKSATDHHQQRGWLVVGSEDYQAAVRAGAEASFEDKTVEELREEAKARGISPLPTKKAELIEALQVGDERDTKDQDQAGDEPAPSEEG